MFSKMYSVLSLTVTTVPCFFVVCQLDWTRGLYQAAARSTRLDLMNLKYANTCRLVDTFAPIIFLICMIISIYYEYSRNRKKFQLNYMFPFIVSSTAFAVSVVNPFSDFIITRKLLNGHMLQIGLFTLFLHNFPNFLMARSDPGRREINEILLRFVKTNLVLYFIYLFFQSRFLIFLKEIHVDVKMFTIVIYLIVLLFGCWYCSHEMNIEIKTRSLDGTPCFSLSIVIGILLFTLSFFIWNRDVKNLFVLFRSSLFRWFDFIFSICLCSFLGGYLIRKSYIFKKVVSLFCWKNVEPKVEHRNWTIITAFIRWIMDKLFDTGVFCWIIFKTIANYVGLTLLIFNDIIYLTASVQSWKHRIIYMYFCISEQITLFRTSLWNVAVLAVRILKTAVELFGSFLYPREGYRRNFLGFSQRTVVTFDLTPKCSQYTNTDPTPKCTKYTYTDPTPNITISTNTDPKDFLGFNQPQLFISSFAASEGTKVYTINQLMELSETALNFGCKGRYLGMSAIPGNLLFRTKPKEYIDEVLASGRMERYQKDLSGHDYAPLTFFRIRIAGLFFTIPARLPENRSPFGIHRIKIEARHLWHPRTHHLYFADFYCNSTKDYRDHYITLVSCVKNSQSDKFCSKYLLKLSPTDNHFFVCQKNNYKVGLLNKVRYELFYTEDISDIKKIIIGEPETIEKIGAGKAVGASNNKSCVECNPEFLRD